MGYYSVFLVSDGFNAKLETFTELNMLNVSALSEANPEKFNSRFRNKMFYAGVSVLAGLFCLLHLHIKVLVMY